MRTLPRMLHCASFVCFAAVLLTNSGNDVHSRGKVHVLVLSRPCVNGLAVATICVLLSRLHFLNTNLLDQPSGNVPLSLIVIPPRGAF